MAGDWGSSQGWRDVLESLNEEKLARQRKNLLGKYPAYTKAQW